MKSSENSAKPERRYGYAKSYLPGIYRPKEGALMKIKIDKSIVTKSSVDGATVGIFRRNINFKKNEKIVIRSITKLV